MTQQHQQQTAKIYTFPKRPRTASATTHAASDSKPHDARFDAVEFGAGWYHEAAVEDAAEDRSVLPHKH